MIVLQIRARQQYLESRLARRARRHPVATGPVAMTTDASRTVPAPVLPTAEKHGHQPYELNASSRPPPFVSPSTEQPNAHVPTASALAHADIHAVSATRMPSLVVSSPVGGVIGNENDDLGSPGLFRTPSPATDRVRNFTTSAIASNETHSIVVPSTQESGGKVKLADVGAIVGSCTATARSRRCTKASKEMTVETVGATVEGEADKSEVDKPSVPLAASAEMPPTEDEEAATETEKQPSIRKIEEIVQAKQARDDASTNPENEE